VVLTEVGFWSPKWRADVLQNVWVAIAMGMTLARVAGVGYLSSWPSVVQGKSPA
jgi:hypothetical protein